MEPEMTVTAACTDNIDIYVMLHKLGLFGSTGLQSKGNPSRITVYPETTSISCLFQDIQGVRVPFPHLYQPARKLVRDRFV